MAYKQHKSWYSVVSVGRCSLFPSRVGLRTYKHPCTGAEAVWYMWCDKNGLTVETAVLYVPCLKMCCFSLQCRQTLSSTDMSLPLTLLSAKQKSAVNSHFSHYKMSRQSTVTIYLKTPTKLTQETQRVQ